MDSLLLVTKIEMPRARPDGVRRPRLTERLDDALRRGKRLTLVCAPAGFGKTTLITEWLDQPDSPVAWLSLDVDDNDPVQFLHLLITAFQRIDPAVGVLTQQALRLPQAPPLQGLLTALINDLAALRSPLLLVFDDYHLITDTVIHLAVEFLIEHQPTAMHTVIISRTDPPLPLSRLRVRNQITEIRERDLRFTGDECAAFFDHAAGLRLSPESVNALETRTEGWVAGLQLAALALQGDQVDVAAFINTFTGSDRFVAEYLMGEVVRQQPPALQTFLRQTSILDRLNAAVCNALTGRDDSQAMLERLQAANLFLISLDPRREWFRYYRLFAEFLRGTLDADETNHLHRRAMDWYAANGHAGRAIQHALSCGALDDAERLIAAAADTTFHNGGITTLANWLAALPPDRVRSNFDLAVMMGWIYGVSNRGAAAREYATAAEDRLTGAHVPPSSRGKLLLLRAYIGLAERDYDAVQQYAARALADLDHPHWRITALWVMAEAQERMGRIMDSTASLREAQRIGHTLGAAMFAAIIESFLASALNEQGRRRDAVTVCEQALARYVDSRGQPLPVAGLIFGRLAQLDYEANRLDLAGEHLEPFVALSAHIDTGALRELAGGTRAKVLAARGDLDTALSLLRDVTRDTVELTVSDSGWLSAEMVNIWLKRGDTQQSLDRVQRRGWTPNDTPQYLHIDEHLAYARCLIAADRLDDVGRWLDRLERFTQDSQLLRRRLTVHILLALVAERAGRHAAARDVLTRAVRFATPEDYTRAFLDEHPQVISLLQQVRHAAPDFVDRVLNTARADALPRQAAVDGLAELLSDRELEVLRLIAAGLSNAEIADRLVIAGGTVKRHINNIYGKLDVGSRTQALVKARDLGLLTGSGTQGREGR